MPQGVMACVEGKIHMFYGAPYNSGKLFLSSLKSASSIIYKHLYRHEHYRDYISTRR